MINNDMILYLLEEKNPKKLLEIINKYTGTKAVHTLDYMVKFPSRKKNLV